MSQSLIFAHFLFFGERCEWIAHFAQIKWAMWVNRSFRSNQMSAVSELLILLTKNERPWAIRSDCSEEMSDREQIAHFWTKMSNSLGNQMSEFPALANSVKFVNSDIY